MMERAKGDGEFITDFERKSALLAEGQMMGLGGFSAADDARMCGDKHEMRFVP